MPSARNTTKRLLTGGPMDGTLVERDDLVIKVQEQVPFNVYHAIGRVSPIRPGMTVAKLDGRIGTYELQADGTYSWAGWQDGF